MSYHFAFQNVRSNLWVPLVACPPVLFGYLLKRESVSNKEIRVTELGGWRKYQVGYE
jgi:hypothetical protein